MTAEVLPRLLVDENASGVSKWLRFFGFDTIQAQPGTPDDEIRHQAENENRILITRDLALAKSLPKTRSIYIKRNELKWQLRHLLHILHVPPQGLWFSRCSQCNIGLQELSQADVAKETRIPEFIRLSDDPRKQRAWRCDECKRIYWEGSHHERTQSFLEDLVKDVLGGIPTVTHQHLEQEAPRHGLRQEISKP